MSINHFGINLRGNENDNKLCKENFSILTEKVAKQYPHYAEEIIYNRRQKENLEIYEVNIDYYKRLNKKEFEEEVKRFVKENKFIEVRDLKKCKLSGIYLMVIGKYKQVYIGKSVNIYNRIQEHWRKQLEFYKIKSRIKITIDSFRALDTTQIYYFPCEEKELFKMELEFIENFNSDYLCNSVITYYNPKTILKDLIIEKI